MRYVRVVNFERYQHYKDRRPPWVKMYRDFWVDEKIWPLEPATKALGLLLVTLQSEVGNAIAIDREFIGARLNMSQEEVGTHLEALLQAGFLASTRLASRYHAASKVLGRAGDARSREGEVERELPPNPPQGGNGRLSEKELRRFTGCRETRGDMGTGWKQDPLGTAKPPEDWPWPKPTRAQVEAALALS